jgi:hypothetical protein
VTRGKRRAGCTAVSHGIPFRLRYFRAAVHDPPRIPIYRPLPELSFTAVMTALPFNAPSASCQAAPACGYPLCFLARFEGSAGQRPVVRAVGLCAGHLGDAVQDLTAWARERGYEGTVTVLAVGQPPPQRPAGHPTGLGSRLPSDFAFGRVLVGPQHDWR